MRLTEILTKLASLYSQYGDLEIAIVTHDQVRELSGVVEWDSFEPGHPGYIVIETAKEI